MSKPSERGTKWPWHNSGSIFCPWAMGGDTCTCTEPQRSHLKPEIVQQLRSMSLFAFIGEDEHGSGLAGIKIGLVPAGMIPLVAIDREKIDKYMPLMEEQARLYGKKIAFVRFSFEGIISTTEAGE